MNRPIEKLVNEPGHHHQVHGRGGVYDACGDASAGSEQEPDCLRNVGYVFAAMGVADTSAGSQKCASDNCAKRQSYLESYL